MTLLDRLHERRARLTQQQQEQPKGSLMLWIMAFNLLISFLRWRSGK